VKSIDAHLRRYLSWHRLWVCMRSFGAKIRDKWDLSVPVAMLFMSVRARLRPGMPTVI
jgi:hypothetical protein